MKGVIGNYRRGRHTQHTDQVIVYVEGVKSKEEAGKLLGKKVELNWKNGKMIGKVVAIHGNNGAVRVRFSKGIPGQAIGKEVNVVI